MHHECVTFLLSSLRSPPLACLLIARSFTTRFRLTTVHVAAVTAAAPAATTTVCCHHYIHRRACRPCAPPLLMHICAYMSQPRAVAVAGCARSMHSTRRAALPCCSSVAVEVTAVRCASVAVPMRLLLAQLHAVFKLIGERARAHALRAECRLLLPLLLRL